MKHKKAPNLGRSLVKKQDRKMEASSRHTTEVHGGGHPTISITENTSVQEFLANAEAAQKSFEAERTVYTIVGHEDQLSDVSEDEDGESYDEDDDEEDDDDAPFCTIPKKPDWRQAAEGASGEGGTATSEEFKQKEAFAFLKWKRKLAKLQAKNPQLPPFEKNLDFWRQLWRIVELSDVVVQVVDARNPLFFFSQDLADYVKEVGEWKTTVLLLNKADFLTPSQRAEWAKYFKDGDMKALFFSAMEDDDEPSTSDTQLDFNTGRIMTPHEVLETLQSVSSATPLTVGFLGYPNVGKSSTINRFLTNKRLQVSATPGKTKHYQTHVLKGEVVLVDGPGLVIPNLSMTKADMVLHGILPIDQLTDWQPAMDKLLGNVPFAAVQMHYGIMASCVNQAKRADRFNESNQILSAFGIMRGFMKPGGVPDQSRAARVVLKDYVIGKLLFCYAPPDVEQEAFCNFDVKDMNEDIELTLEESLPELRLTSGVHTRGVNRNTKKGEAKKGSNKKKREKIRRVYKDTNPYAM